MTLIGHRDPAIRVIGEPDDEESAHARLGRMKLLRRDTRNYARNGANDEEERREGERLPKTRKSRVGEPKRSQGRRKKERRGKRAIRPSGDAARHEGGGGRGEGVTRNLRSLRKVATRRLIRAASLLKGRAACAAFFLPFFFSFSSLLHQERGLMRVA